MRKARRAARILQVGDFVGVGRRKLTGRGLDLIEAVPVTRAHAAVRAGLFRIGQKLRRAQEKRRVAALQHYAELLHVDLTTAEACWKWEGNGPETRIYGAEEASGELGARFGDHGNPIVGVQAHRDEALRVRKRILAELRKGIGPDKLPPCVM